MVATAQVWTVLHDQLLGFLEKRINDKEDAKDLLQEIFIKIHLRQGQLQENDKLQSWVYAMAHHTVIDYYRKKKLVQSPIENSIPDTVEASFFADLEKCLLPLIQQLPEHYRKALILADIKGLAQKDVAQTMGLSLSGAKSRIQRGRELLKKSFVEHCRFHLDEDGNLRGEHGCEHDPSC